MLLDHFHPPLSERRNWKGFHNEWATYMSADINRRLPEQWFATTVVEFGVEIDVATIEEFESAEGASEAVGGVEWTPSAPQLTIALPVVSDVVEVQVFRDSGGRHLVAAVELVSPANKDRPESRDAFVAKCESLLGAGVGLVVVDVVTTRHANLHEELLDRLNEAGNATNRANLYAAAYHPVQRGDAAALDVWHEPLVVGEPLPTMPLFLRGGPCVPVDLDASYRRTCDEQKIPRPQ